MQLFPKNLFPRGLMERSLLILIAPVLIIQAFTTFMFFDRHWDKVTASLSFALAGEIAIIATRFENDPKGPGPDAIIAHASQSLDILISFEDGGVLAAKPETKKIWEKIVVQALSKAMDRQVRRPYSIALSLEEKWVEIDVQLKNGVLHISCPRARLFTSSGYIFLLWMIGSSILMLGIAILFMRNQIRPIRKLAITAERYGKGRDVPFMKPSGAREVRAATEAFAKMRERIDRQIQQRTSMLSGVSHDLRTPLTRMKLQLEMLPDTPDLQHLKSDVTEMERMLNAYLEFARGEGGESLQRVNASAILNKVVDAARRTNPDIIADYPETLNLQGRPMALERCLTNIVTNAVKYAKKVWIKADTENEMLRITVEDDGPGIPEKLYEDVFRPFYRIESSRNQKTGGVGLGLAITQDIVHSHGGEISLHKSDKGGLKVLIELPL